MKTIFFLMIALSTAATNARAEIFPRMAIAGAESQFVTKYNLNSFLIASDSQRLVGMGEVTTGSVEISEGGKQLRLRLERTLNCPAGALCPAVMPTNTVITLPIRHIGTNICGGTTILAERNLQLVDGGLIRVEVEDMNGSRCGSGSLLTVIKKVKVIVTEQGARDRSEVMSVMSGSVAFP